jgi:hypothetical protein
VLMKCGLYGVVHCLMCGHCLTGSLCMSRPHQMYVQITYCTTSLQANPDLRHTHTSMQLLHVRQLNMANEHAAHSPQHTSPGPQLAHLGKPHVLVGGAAAETSGGMPLTAWRGRRR